MRSLGTKTSKKFLTHLIPQSFDEVVYENINYWLCDVRGFVLDDDTWAYTKRIIKGDFEDNLIEIEEKSSRGVRFVVYLRKDL